MKNSTAKKILGILAVGPFAALAGGAAAGVGAGGLAGALVGLGIPENEAALRAQEVHDGGVLVTCESDDAELLARASSVLERHSARDVFAV